jgi:hypothetical protein
MQVVPTIVRDGTILSLTEMPPSDVPTVTHSVVSELNRRPFLYFGAVRTASYYFAVFHRSLYDLL